jgi:hypothetical protein
MEAFMEAQKEAAASIKSDLRGAIDKYYDVAKDKAGRAIVEAPLSSPELDFNVPPGEPEDRRLHVQDRRTEEETIVL